MDQPEHLVALEVRPYQILCAICSIGAGEPEPTEAKVRRILTAIRESPDRPIALRCNAGDVYVYQDPGTADDTVEGAEYNRKRDLDILQKLDLAPGSMLPARTLLFRVLNTIPTVAGICGHPGATGDAWRGCPRADSGDYERGHEMGIDALIPRRNEEEMTQEKRRSLEALYAADEVTIRPHLLMCSVCQYGGGVRPPLDADNLPEFLELVLTERPDIPVALVPGADWMMCAPCPRRVPELNACVNVAGSGGLSNEKRDLDLLQKLGLTYGVPMPARDLYLLLLEKVPTTAEICARDNSRPSVWWDGCGQTNHDNLEGNENYQKGRRMLLQELRGTDS